MEYIEHHVLRIPKKALKRIAKELGVDILSDQQISDYLGEFVGRCIERFEDPHIEIIKFANEITDLDREIK